MTPRTQPHTRRVPIRRSAALLAVALTIAGTPLVARALDDDVVAETAPFSPVPAIEVLITDVPTIEVDRATPNLVQAERRIAERLVPPIPPTPDIVDVPTDTVPDTVPAPVLPPGPNPSQWEALRQCESNGNYAITNPSGKYRGAYQFDRSTWNSVAERYALNLVGVDPAAASPADQDGMAFALYTERGASPWPHCGRHLS